jgi:hemoglobin-like flavoprotein
MALGRVTAPELELAEASYARCVQSPGFFRSFYDRFLASDPAIPPYFAATRFDRQDKLLQHGVSLLLIYAKRPNPSLLDRIAERHGPKGLSIPPALFPPFIESFIDTVREFDPEFNAGIEAAWRAAIAPGAAYIRGAGA